MTEFLDGPAGRRIAFERQPGKGPGVVFLGGFRSDMRGTKAEYLADWAARDGRAYLRFDYSGHGESGGAFEDGEIGAWAADAIAAISALTDGPQVLVGSSMGGWISLLVARAMPEKVAGLVGIAAAPDFTEIGYWDSADEAQRASLLRDGRWELPSEYSDEPYVITRRLIEEGRDQLVLDKPLALPFPVRLLQGTADEDVPRDWALRLMDHADSPDLRLVLVKGADHRFSTPECLSLITGAIAEVLRG
ncbi:alpha/beta hydrolase [Paracoccus aurantiacus]|uniref:Palmitoyl-protein thioesterase ABHD10, mitochondrial n=1 Tax=Paracoccus aurantiacus TaxID=2599412 RepID=A0A5C6S879_9RHOB|nr:alpha/beta hydrolase [Paracoccus aurantiacus]TXB70578.1 alpha/beta hydrolase [Paracoccus aurantiacus]